MAWRILPAVNARLHRHASSALILLLLSDVCQPSTPFLMLRPFYVPTAPVYRPHVGDKFDVPLRLPQSSRLAPSVAVYSSGGTEPAEFSVREPIGRITTLDRSKIADEPDRDYYAAPRLVTHADDAWIAQVTALYKDRIPKEGVVLDLMGSHVSHLPGDGSYSRVDVHGMNAVELQQNPAVQTTGGNCFLHDLNKDPTLSFVREPAQYDAVLCALGVQYLEEAEQVFADVARVLKPSGVVIVSFSSNLFYEKALTGWIERGMRGRSRLVKDYLRAAGGFDEIEEIGAEGASGVLGTLASILPGGTAGDPFGAVVATRSSE